MDGTRQDRTFADKMSDMFPDERPNQRMEIGGTYAREITFQVTEACNMRCTYCYQHNKTPNRMSFETAKKFIDMVLASDERTINYINSKESLACVLDFIGGEPLLEIDLIDQIVDYFVMQTMLLNHRCATRYIINIDTNGLLYFDPKVQRFLQKHKGNVNLNITIDGCKEIHDMCRLDTFGQPTYDRCFAASYDWARHQDSSYPHTKITLAPQNVEMTELALKTCISNGYKIIHINCCYEEGWKLEHAKILYQQLKNIVDYIVFDHQEYLSNTISIIDNPCGKEVAKEDYDRTTWCGGLGLMIALAPDGYIYPCIRYTPSSNPDNIKLVRIGHVDHGVVITDEEKAVIEEMKKITYRSQFTGTTCENCKIALGCGNCPAYGYEITGKLGYRTMFHCITHQARVLATAYNKNMKFKYHGIGTPMELNIPKEWAIPIVGEDEYEMLKSLSDEVMKYGCNNPRTNCTT